MSLVSRIQDLATRIANEFNSIRSSLDDIYMILGDKMSYADNPITGDGSVVIMVRLTQTQYDALATKSDACVYLIVG